MWAQTLFVQVTFPRHQVLLGYETHTERRCWLDCSNAVIYPCVRNSCVARTRALYGYQFSHIVMCRRCVCMPFFGRLWFSLIHRRRRHHHQLCRRRRTIEILHSLSRFFRAFRIGVLVAFRLVASPVISTVHAISMAPSWQTHIARHEYIRITCAIYLRLDWSYKICFHRHSIRTYRGGDAYNFVGWTIDDTHDFTHTHRQRRCIDMHHFDGKYTHTHTHTEAREMRNNSRNCMVGRHITTTQPYL